jgi:hypothetical protein
VQRLKDISFIFNAFSHLATELWSLGRTDKPEEQQDVIFVLDLRKGQHSLKAGESLRIGKSRVWGSEKRLVFNHRFATSQLWKQLGNPVSEA